MIEIFGTDFQKNLYLKKLYTGEWGGTMVLTEPEAGSDVMGMKSNARRDGDDWRDDGSRWPSDGRRRYGRFRYLDQLERPSHPV